MTSATDLILSVRLRAQALDNGEAIQIGDLLVAKSPNIDLLRVGVLTANSLSMTTWRRGDFEGVLSREMGCRLDWRKAGDDASYFAAKVRLALYRPAFKIKGFGRTKVTVLGTSGMPLYAHGKASGTGVVAARFAAPGCQMCGAHPEDPCDCFDPQGD